MDRREFGLQLALVLAGGIVGGATGAAGQVIISNHYKTNHRLKLSVVTYPESDFARYGVFCHATGNSTETSIDVNIYIVGPIDVPITPEGPMASPIPIEGQIKFSAPEQPGTPVFYLTIPRLNPGEYGGYIFSSPSPIWEIIASAQSDNTSADLNWHFVPSTPSSDS